MISRLTKFREDREGGFTLVELLVVIIIIGILAAIAIPVFLNQRQRANDAAVQSAVKSYVNAYESHLVNAPNENQATVTEAKAEGARLSNGVTILMAGDQASSTGYTVCGWHSNGKAYKHAGATPNATDKAYVYRSGEGTYSTWACPENPVGAIAAYITTTN